MEQGKIMEAEVPTVRVGTTPTGLTAPPPPQPPRNFTGRMPFLPPNQQRQSTEGILTSVKDYKIKYKLKYKKVVLYLAAKVTHDAYQVSNM